MTSKARFLKETYSPVQEIPGSGRYYHRAVIREEEAGVIVLTLEETTDGYPTPADTERLTKEATEANRLLTIAGDTDKINTLKQELADGDYKVTKNGEWRDAQEAITGVKPALADEGWPYPPIELHEEREAIRAEIHRLEQEIEDLTPVINEAGASK